MELHMVKPRIFSSGQICGGTYTILSLCARSPVAESYVARHRRTRDEVILTCSRLDHGESGARLRSTFLDKAAKLKVMSIEDAPKILGAGVSDGVYWIAREHFHDALPLSEIFSGNNGERIYGDWQKVYSGAPLLVRAVVALRVGIDVSSVLASFAAGGVFHGGLDPARTLVVREHGDVAVLESGYHALFGAEHFPVTDDLRMVRAPESAIQAAPDEVSDIYAFGVILSRLLARGALHGLPGPSRSVAGVLAGMTRERPEHRIQRWQQVHDTLRTVLDEYLARAEQAAAKLADGNADAALPEEPCASELDAQSGRRDRSADEEIDTERTAPPAPLDENGEELTPATTPSYAHASPISRAPEQLASACVTLSSAAPAESVGEASSSKGAHVEPLIADSPPEGASSTEGPLVVARVRLLHVVEPIVPPISRTFRPSHREHTRMDGASRRLPTVLGIAASAILLLASFRVLMTRAVDVPESASAPSGSSIGANRLSDSEPARGQTSAPSSSPNRPSAPPGKRSRGSSTWHACDDFVVCTARRSSGLQ